MVDNEKIALPHYGLTEADVVYEMMNSTANGRITRRMAIVKDWAAKPYSNGLSGGFKRINNGKAREFTEYVCTGEIASRIYQGVQCILSWEAFHILGYGDRSVDLSRSYDTGKTYIALVPSDSWQNVVIK